MSRGMIQTLEWGIVGILLLTWSASMYSTQALLLNEEKMSILGVRACHDVLRLWSGGKEIPLAFLEELFPGRNARMGGASANGGGSEGKKEMLVCEGERYWNGKWENAKIWVEK